jgi:hypothetical protein
MTIKYSNDIEGRCPDHDMLVEYLRYAIDDLAALNETSAALVRMAIVSLKEETRLVPSEFE